MAIPMTTLSDWISCLSLCSSSVDRSPNAAAATAALLSAVIQTHTQASTVYWRGFFREKYGRHGGEANICRQLFAPNLSSLSIYCLICHFYVKTTNKNSTLNSSDSRERVHSECVPTSSLWIPFDLVSSFEWFQFFLRVGQCVTLWFTLHSPLTDAPAHHTFACGRAPISRCFHHLSTLNFSHPKL